MLACFLLKVFDVASWDAWLLFLRSPSQIERLSVAYIRARWRPTQAVLELSLAPRALCLHIPCRSGPPSRRGRYVAATTGANHGGKVKDPFDDLTGPQNVGHLFIVIKPGIFVGKNYLSQIKKNLKAVKRLPKSNMIKEILYPGENKHAKYKKNIKKGIEVPNNILKEINKLNAI